MSDASYALQLREMIRILERKLGLLEKVEISCCGVTYAQCHTIVEIGKKEVIALNELAELLGLDISTMSRTVNNLVNSNLVNRQINPDNRRSVTIALTEAGKKVYRDIEDSMQAYFEKIYALLPETKGEQVLESLNLLLEAVSKKQCRCLKRED